MLVVISLVVFSCQNSLESNSNPDKTQEPTGEKLFPAVQITFENDSINRVFRCDFDFEVRNLLGNPTEEQESIFCGEIAFHPTTIYYRAQSLRMSYYWCEGDLSLEECPKNHVITHYEMGKNSGLVINGSIRPGISTKDEIREKLGDRFTSNSTQPLFFSKCEMFYAQHGLGFSFDQTGNILESVLIEKASCLAQE
ncbi:MAG: hypothetical protein KDC12_11255 [Flavobacteriales bacterium]|nr:hypothetical protein [Flavobacteriales bacterium]